MSDEVLATVNELTKDGHVMHGTARYEVSRTRK
jgi:hypothetical protein